MDIKPVCLVIADISGYTTFLKFRQLSLLHAEQIISSLLETVVRNAEYPLTLSKFEGDAVFLYAMAEPDNRKAAEDVLRQATSFFEAFQAKQKELVQATDGGCLCEACRQINQLKLKAFLHYGSALFKRILQFEELAGEDVILIHRLLKNTIGGKEYIAMTEQFHSQLSGDRLTTVPHVEKVADFDAVRLFVHYPGSPDIPSQPHAPLTRLRGTLQIFTTTAKALKSRLVRKSVLQH